MVKSKYVPDSGDLIWLSFSTHSGREQAGRRPALVLSPRKYNAQTGLCLVCPITSRAKGYPFEVLLPTGGKVAGVVLSDHVKSADWRTRKAAYVGRVAAEAMAEVHAKLRPLIGI